jgi:hypothetical protein
MTALSGGLFTLGASVTSRSKSKDAEATGAVFAELAQRYTKEERQAVRLRALRIAITHRQTDVGLIACSQSDASAFQTKRGIGPLCGVVSSPRSIATRSMKHQPQPSGGS